jgi:hypothetical protein
MHAAHPRLPPACARTRSQRWRVPLFAAVVSVFHAAVTLAATAEGIAALERERFSAMARGDVATLEPLLADDLTYCHSNGECETKAQFLASLESGRLRYRAIEVQSLAPRRVDGVWVVTGVVAVAADREGEPPAQLRLAFTDVYAPSQAGWQLAAWHSSRAP